ncbi:FAD-dependent oxidoreductase [Actinorhabdospora filicis]|uniref:FAD-dependent oxidoreductase n=1 Tax=Actinorhabdospora filicis TaxID=1785913 RepID=A0A9W6WBZ0_9ACTN|nr:FAD-dependent monooxygenase [Actinorhabdospora filicis]GLZ80061.1 FAD-dependent oxidoreductase [Actinorhabdospora filicis]
MKSVLISGSSVAGPALALWLRRAGWQVTVIEKAPAPRPGGYKVDLRGVAVRVVDLMGVGRAVRERATAIRGGQWMSEKGKSIVTLGPDLIGFRDPGDLEILRGDLAEIVRAQTHGTEYIYGDVITAMHEDATGVHVDFGRHPSRRFDVVIGADGLHSGVRALAFGPEERFSRPIGLSVAVFDAPNHLGYDRWEVSCSTPGRVAAAYGLSPSAPLTVQLFFSSPEVSLARAGRDEQERAVRAAFAGQGWETPRLLQAMPSSADLYYDDLAQIEMDAWSRGRTALVGDAAYCPSPASGQGTGLALVGAYVLAGELATAPDHVTAFANYEKVMREYVAMNQKLGRDIAGKLVPSTAFGAFLGRLMMRYVRIMPFKKAMMEPIMKPIRAASNGIDLPGYPIA